MVKCEAHEDFARHWGETRDALLKSMVRIEGKIDDLATDVATNREARVADAATAAAHRRVVNLTLAVLTLALAIATMAWRLTT